MDKNLKESIAAQKLSFEKASTRRQKSFHSFVSHEVPFEFLIDYRWVMVAVDVAVVNANQEPPPLKLSPEPLQWHYFMQET